MSEEQSFLEKLGSAGVDEVEALWKEALRDFMDKIGVPKRYVEAEAAVLASDAWKGMAADWITLPTKARESRYGELLELLRKAGYETRAECLRCGDCCRRSGPTLFLDDLRLFTDGVVQRSQVFTIRRGERVRVPAGLGSMVLKEETIKLRENPETGHCLFLDDDIDRCQIYGERPLQCRAQACWDTADIEHAIAHEERLSRAHVISPDEPVAEAILAHESHCALEHVADAFAELAEGNERALDRVLDALVYDTELRPLLAEKLPLPADELDFYFGRPLTEVIEMYGVGVERDPDGSHRLVPLAPSADGDDAGAK